MKELVIIGGGPVGLWTAIQTRKRRPDCRVTVYERHESYQREHVLKLDHWSLLLYGRLKSDASDPHQQAFFDEVTGKNLASVALSAASSVFIRTLDLEAALKRYALALGVGIRYQRISSPGHAHELHPDCLHFVAADGARSLLRTELLGADCVRDKPLQHIVELKYKVPGQAPRLNPLATSRKLRHMAFEYVGKAKEGYSPVTLRVFLPKDVYERIPAASFKEPLALDSPLLPNDIREDLLRYTRMQGAALATAADSNFCIAQGRVTKLVLSMYASEQFCVAHEGRGWFLCGDAAMGVPYFRALNSGLILGSRLAQLLCSTRWPLSGRLDRQLKFYEWHRVLHVATEFSIARSKDATLQALDWARKGAARQQPLDVSAADDFERQLQALTCTQHRD